MLRKDAKFRLWIWLTLSLKLTPTIPDLLWSSVCDVRCDCNWWKISISICNRKKIDIVQTHCVIIYPFQVNIRVIVIENRQKIFQLQLQISTFDNVQLQLQQNRVINYNFVNYNYNFSKPARESCVWTLSCLAAIKSQMQGATTLWTKVALLWKQSQRKILEHKCATTHGIAQAHTRELRVNGGQLYFVNTSVTARLSQ